MKGSNFLPEYKTLNVEIITTSANTTAYQIKQTQGAEFGDEAELVRMAFEQSLKNAFVQNARAMSPAEEMERQALDDNADWMDDKQLAAEHKKLDEKYRPKFPHHGKWKVPTTDWTDEAATNILAGDNSNELIAQACVNVYSNYEQAAATAQGICRAMNGTFGKGINPDAVLQLFNALRAANMSLKELAGDAWAHTSLKYEIDEALKNCQL